MVSPSICEAFVSRFLSALKILVAMQLMSKYKMSQRQAARLVGIPQPLLSYAIGKKRKAQLIEKLSSNSELMKQIEAVADRIARGEAVSTCILCTIFREYVWKNLVYQSS